ncbi:serine/threonine protein kinase [Bremerella alba]|uniref:Serine/threonine-protein kinase PknD n=1 Tax=Bremerella alba TaxID=980252 RepID=A0A7V8V7K8_9BACT|nr:serine/threonine-protein kinase [Bremerella alba]MBA2116156.1 Serine/threonine-protein kinase PknD [Bremerella alba]
MTTDPNLERLQQIFLAAMEIPEQQRDRWLEKECGTDATLLQNVRSLLGHANANNDPLEQSPDKAIADFTLTDPDAPIHSQLSIDDDVSVDCEQFLSKLSEVGILSQAELDSVSDHRPEQSEMPDPRTLAAQLVQEGKLTQYQATALLRGEPELLIDKYLIVDLIDVGGMGMVFKAIHRSMDRVVAVKIISPKMLGSSDHVKRFRREVRVAATLEHPNVVRSYDADESRGINFLVMEYVRGKNLRQIIRESGPMSLSQAVDSIRQAAVGLDYAHQHGVIHRDIKPGNLLLNTQDTIKILDLGLAHVDESLMQFDKSGVHRRDSSLAESEITTAGMVLGTASFMAPEQSLNSHLVDARTDVYSLGCTLFYLLTGDPVYQGDTVFQVLVRHRESEIPIICEIRADVPQSVNAVFQQMVAKEPADRFQSMQEVVEAIDACNITAPNPKPSRLSRDRAENVQERADRPASTIPSITSRNRSMLIGVLSVLALTIFLALILSPIFMPQRYGKSSENSPTLTESIAAADLLATGDWTWRIQENLGPIVNSKHFELSADMTDDGCTIVFSSTRDQLRPGDRDLWISTRDSVDEEWSAAVRLPAAINTVGNSEQLPNISGDGLTLRFRRGASNMLSTRTSQSQPWSESIPDPWATRSFRDYTLTKDGLTQVRPITRPQEEGTDVRSFLLISRRSSTDKPFGEVREDPLPNEAQPVGLGSLSNDGRIFVYPMDIDSSEGGKDYRLFYVTRQDWGEPWSTPQRVFPNAKTGSGLSSLVQDSKALLLITGREGGLGGSDIWLSRLEKK